MDKWVICTEIPIYSDELICSARLYLAIRNSSWAYASDEAIAAKLDELGFRKEFLAAFDRALINSLEPPPLSVYDHFSKSYPPIDWHAIGVRVGKLYLNSKRRLLSNVTTK